MDFDLILTELGECGLWQMLMTFLFWLPATIDGIVTLTASFTALTPSAYRCNIPDCENTTGFKFDDFPKDDLFPSIRETHPNFCSYYKPKVSDDGSCLTEFSENITDCLPGSTFAYDKFAMSSTLVTDFDMVCDESKKAWVPVINTFFMVGLALGSFIFGILSDKLGRRHSLLLAILLCSCSSLASSFLPNYWTYALIRMLVGAGAEGCYIVAFTMVMEMVGVRQKLPCLPWVSYSTLQGNMIMIPFALGEVTVSITALQFTNWRHLQLALSVFCLLCSVIWFVIPESPRWLISQGKYDKAKEVIEKAAKMNKVTISSSLLDPPDCDHDNIHNACPQYGLLDLFHTTVWRHTVAFFICWPVITLLYYGLTFSADKIHLTDNTNLSFIIISVIEIPACLLLILVMDVWGRKPLFVISLLVPGVACLGAGFLDEGTLFSICVIIGKFFVAGAMNLVHMFTAELYPTSIRTTVLGSCSTIARIGGIVAPWIAVYLPDQGSVDPHLPLYIFGSTAFLGGLAALLLPETLGSALPNTFEDIEMIKRNSKSMCACFVNAHSSHNDDN